MDLETLKQKYRELIEKAREKIYTLTSTQRDRRALLIGGSAIVIIVLYLIFHSYTSGTANLERRYAQLENELTEVKMLKAEYLDSKKQIAELSSKIKKENEALISVVEKILLKENLDRQNFSIRDVNTRSNSEEDFYEEKSVDVELSKISLETLVDILYTLQNRPSLKVGNLNITTKFDKANSMKVKLRVSTYEFKQVS
ncbi:MAG: type II secretion system protein GspM [Thermodesulfobacteriota bacterium]